MIGEAALGVGLLLGAGCAAVVASFGGHLLCQAGNPVAARASGLVILAASLWACGVNLGGVAALVLG